MGVQMTTTSQFTRSRYVEAVNLNEETSEVNVRQSCSISNLV